MKYIEELNQGDCFTLEKDIYLLTSDFKQNGNRLSYSLKSGNPKWIEANAIVDIESLYTLDNENNIIALKESPKADAI